MWGEMDQSLKTWFKYRGKNKVSFLEPNLIQAATKIVKIFFLNHNNLTKKIHQTYYFCDDSMKDDKMAEKGTFTFVEKVNLEFLLKTWTKLGPRRL